MPYFDTYGKDISALGGKLISGSPIMRYNWKKRWIIYIKTILNQSKYNLLYLLISLSLIG
jgi:hypothetical protein